MHSRGFFVCNSFIVVLILETLAHQWNEGGTFLDKLKSASKRMVEDEATEDEVHAATIEYARLFHDAVGGMREDWRQELDLSSGVAISPQAAVDCITEGGGKRTRVFILALRDAIRDKLIARRNKTPVTVLEFGSGPYAPLAMAMWAFFEPWQVSFTLVDVHAPAIKTLHSISDILGFPFNRSIRILFQDGFTLKNERSNLYDIVVAEVMGPALRREPQVEAFASLSRILDPGDGVILPESVHLIASIPELFPNLSFKFFDVSLRSAENYMTTGHHVTLKVALPVKKAVDQVVNLSLDIRSQVRVYGLWELNHGDSQITLSLPHRCSVENATIEPPGQVARQLALALGYKYGPNPGPFCSVTSDLEHPAAVSMHSLQRANRTFVETSSDCAETVFWKERAAMRHICQRSMVELEDAR